MSDLEKIREWIKTYEGMPQEQDFQIDYVREDSLNAGLMSNGLIELNRQEDVLGNWMITNQLNFALHIVMSKPLDHDAESTRNAEWLLNFQKWVQRQSVMRKAPIFGNTETYAEVIRAQNGMAYFEQDCENVLYIVTISVQYKEEIINEEIKEEY